MNFHFRRALPAFASLCFVAGSAAGAFAQAAPQNAPLSYIADPAVYKLVGENDQFRVIAVARPPGHRDAWHSHSPLTVYNLTACKTRLYAPDGQTRDADSKKGSVTFTPTPTASHAAENIGKSVCRQLIVEHK